MNGPALLILGCLNAFVAVGLGAFGAHGLRARVEGDLLRVWETAVQYHQVHALALLALGVTALLAPAGSRPLIWAGWLMFAGIVLFSGSLYGLVLSGTRGLGAVTPLGGGLFLVSWLLAAWGVWRAF